MTKAELRKRFWPPVGHNHISEDWKYYALALEAHLCETPKVGEVRLQSSKPMTTIGFGEAFWEKGRVKLS